MFDSLYKNTANLAIVIILLLISVFLSVYQVLENETAFIIELGKVKKIVNNAGLYVKIPIIQDVVFFDKRILQVDSQTKEIIALDQKRLIIDAFVKYQIIDPAKFYERVRNENGANIRIFSILDSSMRQIVATYPLISLLNENREVIMNKIQSNIAEQTKEFGVNIVDVRIIRTDLPNENSEAVFKRMRTDREKEAKELRAEGLQEAKIIQANADKTANIIISQANMEANILKGKADAEVIKIYNKSFSKDVEFYKFYKTMELYSSALPKTKMFLKTNNSFLQHLNNG